MLQLTLAMGYGGTEAQGGAAGMIFMAVWLAACLTVLAGIWKVFTKAGQPGWGAIVPIYNTYLMTKIAQRPAWWLILMFIPVVNVIVHVIMSMDIARHFGKGAGFGVGLACFVFYPIIGFGGARYGDGHDSHAISHDMNAPTDQQQAA